MSKIKGYIKSCGKFIFNYKFTILVMVYIFLVAFIPIQFAFSIPMAIHVLSFLFLLAILAKTKYTFILTFLLGFLLIFNAYFAFAFEADISLGAMASIFETTPAEAVSMMKGGPLLWGLIGLAISVALLYLSEKELKNVKIPLKYIFIGYLAYLLLFLPAICYKRIVWEEEEDLFMETPVRVTQDKVNMYAPLVYGNILTIMAYQEEMHQMRKFINDKDKVLPEGIIYNDTIQAPEKIYLVIGESVYRNHMSLYGYKRKTTPFADSLAHIENSPMSYYMGLAPAAFTRNVLRIALSFASPRDLKPFKEQKTLLNLANDAGYKTYWISNQGKSGIQDTYLGYLAAGAEEQVFPTGGYLADDDFRLIPILQEKHKAGQKQFFVIHLVGSHNDYSDRYDAIDAAVITGEKSLTLDYDRSIHHTDRVLHQIYDIMRQNSTAYFYYFSDHGEVIGKGHGLWKHGKEQYEIPLLTIRQGHFGNGNVVDKYVDKATNLINNSSTVYILAEIMGYEIPQRYIDQSVEDGRYVRHADQSYSSFSDIKENTK